MRILCLFYVFILPGSFAGKYQNGKTAFCPITTEELIMENQGKSVKERFNTLLSKKPVVKYEFCYIKMGRKDKSIIRTLDRYGVQGKKCLDVGPGTGRWLQFLKSRNAAYLGAIDISEKSLERSEHICDKVQIANFETDRFDFDSDFFDILLSIEVIEHLLHPQNYISEIKRVVKHDGLILMSTPNVVSLIARIRMLLGHLPSAIAQDKTHVRFYRQKDLMELFAQFGLYPKFIPTSISLNLRNPKSHFRLPCLKLTSGLADSLLFTIRFSK
jgi:2-polyprenyl-3-methyl-5-hydroxy-6-metoxy-1,4-benzoquinol methylase